MTATTSDHGVWGSLGSERWERWSAAAVYVIGAVCYFVAREFLGLPFTASPLFVGVVMLAASRFRRRLLASAVLLLTWGTAILINGRGHWRPVVQRRSTSLLSVLAPASCSYSAAGSRAGSPWRVWRS